MIKSNQDTVEEYLKLKINLTIKFKSTNNRNFIENLKQSHKTNMLMYQIHLTKIYNQMIYL